MHVRSAMVMVLLGLAALPSRSALAQEAVSTEEMVDALNSVHGSHKGYRAAHAKGFCAAGTFQATAEAADISKASIFDGHAVPTMFRFSLAPGTPDASDLEQAPRSLVARFEPAGGETMDLIMINVPFVFMDEPADFVPFLRALAPDPATGQPDAAKLKAHLDAHPEAKRFVEFLDQAPVPASYAQGPYFAVHTFYFTNARGERRPARWIAEPVAGEAGLTEQGSRIRPIRS